MSNIKLLFQLGRIPSGDEESVWEESDDQTWDEMSTATWDEEDGS